MFYIAWVSTYSREIQFDWTSLMDGQNIIPSPPYPTQMDAALGKGSVRVQKGCKID